MRRLLTPLAALGVFVVLAACDPDETDFKDAAEEAIEGDLAESLALGDLQAACSDPPDTDAGTTFSCTATTEDGNAVAIEAVIEGDDEVFVDTTNVIAPDSIEVFETGAVQLLNEQAQVELAPEDIDCGSVAIIVDEGSPFICALTDTTSGDVYDVEITIEDLDQPDQITVQVAEQPRGA